MASDQEEADTKVFICVQHALETGSSSNHRILYISDLCDTVGTECCKAFPPLHLFTGNDYTSASHGLGKIEAFEIMKESPILMKEEPDMDDFDELSSAVMKLMMNSMMNIRSMMKVTDQLLLMMNRTRLLLIL